MRMKAIRSALLLPLLAAVLVTPARAERGDDTDRKSKNGRTTGVIDGVEITLEYGRPNVNGRQIWDGLVPYGSIWRTGADEATTIELSGDAEIQGARLAAGTYALFTLPDAQEWTFIFNKVPEQWGAFGYDPSQDALRVEAAPAEAEHVESMQFDIEGSGVVLRWEKLAVGFEVAAAP